jgi:O-antigen ligase
LTGVALYLAIGGIFAYHFGYRARELLVVLPEILALYPDLMQRIKGEGVLSDANDLGQFLLMGFCFLGYLWNKGSPIRNFLLVIVPGAILFYGIYLTFSRGAVVGLMAVIFFANLKRVGKVGAGVMGLVAFALMLALKFGGGREMSATEGSATGRIMAWGAGIGLLKSNPLFGVGYQGFGEFNDLTAHNVFVLCFAELGLVGYFFYLAFIITTIIGIEYLVRTPDRGEYIDPYLLKTASVWRLCFYGFLTTSMFLSRTYVLHMYIMVAMAVVLIDMGPKRKVSATGGAVPSWIPLTAALEILSVVGIYGFVKVRAFL